ncbi:non-heme iron oxygenase ferredoxin subunit [Nocardia sp. alder85J]|uniref:non-heme iron oxygenase ferredoxin subunit n=1 Tax=Nocardia sp. alder85J TaxID=2862949 RepID=UPI001CD6594E|nr:non-heme iron oxygenase ferredoxin subunit [Nocardia sp. alder85J]MCX4091051.1 non-heme iron oxygenase ferredoxin subunit [Nocardia sp. alder85J]
MSTGIRVAALDDIPVGEGIAVDPSVTGAADAIALLRDDDGVVYALDDTCPHEVASLAEGWVEGGYVECPMHASKFCLRTGAVQCLPATSDARPHRVEVRDGEVFLYPGQTP